MNFLKNIKNKILPNSANKNSTNNYYTLFTGAHLKYTKDIIMKISLNNPELRFLVLNKDYIIEDENELDSHENLKDDLNKNKFLNAPPILESTDKIQIFNCDVTNEDDLEEFTQYIQSNDFKVKFN